MAVNGFNQPSDGHTADGLYQANTDPLIQRLHEVFIRTWDLGLTGFGGPAAQFLTFRRRFAESSDQRKPWVNEVVYQELFALAQATPGPASTKLLLWLVWIHAGAVPATMVFFLWAYVPSLA